MISTLRNRLEREKGSFQQISQQLEESQARSSALSSRALKIEIAQNIVQEGSKKTQQNLEMQISDITSMSLESVFNEPSIFKLEFVPRRGKTEVDIYIEDIYGNPTKPLEADGGGIANVISFTLRPALWCLTKSSRATLILDEPFHFLHSKDAHKKVAELLSYISKELNLQIIMITGEDESEDIIKNADRVFRVDQRTLIKGGKSYRESFIKVENAAFQN